jgi:Flp pilus assembly protein TadG
MKARKHATSPVVRRGVAATELALLLPFLCFLFVIAVDFSRVFYYDMTVVNCARNGAIYASQTPTTALDTTGITAAAQQEAGNLDLTQLKVSSSTDDPTTPTKVAVTVTYPFSTITKYPGVPSTFTLSRTLHINVGPVKPN